MKCDRVQLPELFRGELSEEEIGPVLAHLEECPSCGERARLMALLQGEPSLLVREKPSRRRFYLALAAAVCLVLAGALIHLNLPSRDADASVRALATSVPYPLVALATRSEASEEDARARAFEAYGRGDFAAAARHFSRLESASRDADVHFFWGVAGYLNDDLHVARAQLEGASRLSEKWVEPSLWYLANLELKSGDLEAARRRLEVLRTGRGEFGAAAEGLLRRLERSE
jgi:hypothetical protein